MESTITSQQYLNGDLQLAEPHFDEEATVLSARPVVPLADIRVTNAGAGSSSRLVVGLSIVVALMLGALAATFIYRQRSQTVAAEVVYAAIPGSGAITPVSTLSASATGEVKGDIAKANGWEVSFPAADKKAEPRIARRVVPPAVNRRVPPVKVAREQAEPRYETDERETRRAEWVDDRRLRRAAERESNRETRGRRHRSADDLLRIREIFEGPRRP